MFTIWYDYVNKKIDTRFTLEGTQILRATYKNILIYDAFDPNDKCLQRIMRYNLFAYDLESGKKLWQKSVYESNFCIYDNKVYFFTKQELCNDDSANLLNIFDLKTKSVTKKIKTSNGKPHKLIVYQKYGKIIVSQDTTYNKKISNSYCIIEDDNLSQTVTNDILSMQFGDYVLASDIQYSITDNQFYGHISCYKPPWFDDSVKPFVIIRKYLLTLWTILLKMKW